MFLVVVVFGSYNVTRFRRSPSCGGMAPARPGLLDKSLQNIAPELTQI